MDGETDATPELMLVDRLGDLILEVGRTAVKEEVIVFNPAQTTDFLSETQSQKEDASSDQDCTDGEEEAASATGSANKQPANPDEGDSLEAKVSYMRIRVSAKALTLASGVFHVMLNGSFVEAQLELSSENPPTLTLPDDDPTAMLNLCRIIHYAPGIHKFIEGYELLHGIVVLCDKYACVEPLRGWFRGQMGKLMLGFKFNIDLLTAYQMEIENILKLTYLMVDYSLFASASATFIFLFTPSETHRILRRGFGDNVPDGLAGELSLYTYERGPKILRFQPRSAGPFGPAEDIGLCRCRVMRIGLLSGALTSMDLCEFSRPGFYCLLN